MLKIKKHKAIMPKNSIISILVFCVLPEDSLGAVTSTFETFCPRMIIKKGQEMYKHIFKNWLKLGITVPYTGKLMCTVFSVYSVHQNVLCCICLLQILLYTTTILSSHLVSTVKNRIAFGMSLLKLLNLWRLLHVSFQKNINWLQ